MKTSRRDWLMGTMAATAACAMGDEVQLKDYRPKSMLRVKQTDVERAKYPVIDIHTHLTWSVKGEKGVPLAEDRRFLETPEYLLAVMDRRNIRALVNLTGGFGNGVRQSVAKFDKAHPGRFYTFTEPWYPKFNDPNFPKFQAEAIEQAHRDGARGLKVLKTLGLYLREQVTSGPLVKVDDPRFDPMWDTCGRLNMPVCIHVADPVAFFTPTDEHNERYEELHNHPDWSFYGKDYPKFEEILAARDRVIQRHPKTNFIVLHVGNYAENLADVGQHLDRFPNMYVEIGARIGELGRQPRTAREFFMKYQDRILFGTDAVPHGKETPQQIYGDDLYKIYYRFLETTDEYFDYAPAEVPPQGRWQIYGLGLPDQVLRKVYDANAAKLLGVTM